MLTKTTEGIEERMKIGQVKRRRRVRRYRRWPIVRRLFLILFGVLSITAVLFWTIRLFNQRNSGPPSAPQVPEDASVQFQ